MPAGLLHGEDGCHRDVALLEDADRRLVALLGLQPFLDDGNQVLLVFGTRRVVDVARVLGQLRPADQFAELRPQMQQRQQEQIGILALEDAGRCHCIVVEPERVGLIAPLLHDQACTLTS